MFSSLIGHRRLVSLLSRAIARDTLPPALLLAGPAGVGKRRVAMAVARVINCTGPAGDTRRLRDPLFEQLVARGIMTPDPHRFNERAVSIGGEGRRPLTAQSPRPLDRRRPVRIGDEKAPH